MPFNLKESYVVVAGQDLGARFPESYRRAIQLANGGEIDAAQDNWQLHPIEDTSEKCDSPAQQIMSLRKPLNAERGRASRRRPWQSQRTVWVMRWF